MQPQGGGRSREQIIRHVYGTEPGQFSRRVEVRTPLEVVLTQEGLATHRRDYLAAHLVMDHAREMEDRDLASRP